MSHVSDLECDGNDLTAMKRGGEALGLEFVKQSTYHWFGTHVGDHPLPKGMTKEDLGKCEYVLRIPGKPEAYEIGIVKRKDGPGYRMVWDFWAGGYGLQEKIGTVGEKLKQEYSIAVYTKEMRKEGFRISREIDTVTQRPVLVARRGV